MTKRNEEPDPEQKTHLVARTRNPRDFRRAGITFTPNFAAYLLADLAPDQVERIKAESMLEVHLVTAKEAEKMAVVAAAEFDPQISRAQLIRHIQAQDRKLTAMAERLAALEAAAKGDHPPKRGQEPPGNVAGNLPGTPKA